MSWTSVFPVLGDEQIAEYRLKATAAERLRLDGFFAVNKVLGQKQGNHIVSASLFWKNATMHEGELPTPTRKLMKEAHKRGLVSRYEPWLHYVQPLLDGAKKLAEERPDVVFRVYLAADLVFLLNDLVAAGCEVHLMETSSLRHNPGAMWRFLALEEEGKFVTVTDSDRAMDVIHDVERTEHVMQAGLGLWRAPYLMDRGKYENDPAFYRPINACHFGTKGGLALCEQMKAFIWHNERGTMDQLCKIGKVNEGSRIFGVDFPSYGFDEWCLSAVVYPRMAFEGVLTFIAWEEIQANHWFALDIEYVTWANAASEILYYGGCDLAEKYLRIREQGFSESCILEAMLDEKTNVATSPLTSNKKSSAATLVVARYKENMHWLLDVPEDVKIVLYNKGCKIKNKKILKRVEKIVDLPNVGREADTYLCHVATYPHGDESEWTIFMQGDPFSHSPQLLESLLLRHYWNDIQPLSAGYLETPLVPAHTLRELERGDWLGDVRIRTEKISLWTLDMVRWQDWGGRNFVKSYCTHHGVPDGWSVAGHFFEQCGLTSLAEKAWRSTSGRFAFGAQFAVRNKMLSHLPLSCVPRMRKIAQGHHAHGYFYEKLWLHIFGLPFEGSIED